LQAAEQAITSAERARVADYASVELSDARDKLSAAHSAVKEEKMVQAQRLAKQARADAELASARAEVARARVVNEQMQKGTDTLKQEMQRKTGDQ
jgi:putative cell wall-binding protein